MKPTARWLLSTASVITATGATLAFMHTQVWLGVAIALGATAIQIGVLSPAVTTAAAPITAAVAPAAAMRNRSQATNSS